jgi:hypothetical protein
MTFKFTRRPTTIEIVNGASVEELELLLSALGESDSFQVWVTDEAGNAVAFLSNASLAYVSSLPITEEWMSAYVPGNDARGVTAIYVENGQLDEFDKSNCVPREAAIRACVEYMKTGKLPTSVAWRPA